jgi:dipeptidyl aminopeptidase/acylaminoacyl peptidase
MYTYVKRSGGTVSFIRYPREGHELTRGGEPAHRLHHMVETLGWLDRYLKS